MALGKFFSHHKPKFLYENNGVCKDLLAKYLEDFSPHKPSELKILIIDNATFHSTKEVELSKNIILFRIPPYCPELNPAERVWEWMKDKIAMKIFEPLAT
jgi:transposase